MTEVTILNSEDIESLLTLPMAIRAVEQAYLEKSRGTAGTWPMVFHEFIPGDADLDIKSGDMGGLWLLRVEGCIVVWGKSRQVDACALRHIFAV